MAYKGEVAQASRSSAPPGYRSYEEKYQCEEDVRTLQRAAEMMADRGRASMALKKFRKQNTGADKLINVLSGHRMRGM